MGKMKDPVFGEMEYDFGWERKETGEFWGRKYNFKIVAQSYSEDAISKLQQEKFKEYEANLERYFKEIPEVLLAYYKENFDEISEVIEMPKKYDKKHILKENVTNLIYIRTLFFAKDGRFGYLCVCPWDEENGLGILLSGEQIEIIEQDELI